MIVSFFNGDPLPVTWVDYSQHPDCLYQEDIQFDPITQDAKLSTKKWVHTIIVSQKIIPETDQEKRKRVFDAFISSSDFSDFDWEGVELTTNEYSQLITARDFSGDNWSQVAMLTKALFKCMALFVQVGIPKETMQAVFSDEIQVANKVSESRVALGLSPFELPL